MSISSNRRLYSFPTAFVTAVVSVAFLAGCGSHKVTYTLPSKMSDDSYTVERLHSHGFGPLLIGGGGLFFLFSEISPALINYTGKVEVSSACPDGFARVEHFHTSEQSQGAALLSWLLIFNVAHGSTVEWSCLRADGPD